jgi:hypothetical protein
MHDRVQIRGARGPEAPFSCYSASATRAAAHCIPDMSSGPAYSWNNAVLSGRSEAVALSSFP